jgi:hypothetical protein
MALLKKQTAMTTRKLEIQYKNAVCIFEPGP